MLEVVEPENARRSSMQDGREEEAPLRGLWGPILLPRKVLRTFPVPLAASQIDQTPKSPLQVYPTVHSLRTKQAGCRIWSACRV